VVFVLSFPAQNQTLVFEFYCKKTKTKTKKNTTKKENLKKNPQKQKIYISFNSGGWGGRVAKKENYCTGEKKSDWRFYLLSLSKHALESILMRTSYQASRQKCLSTEENVLSLIHTFLYSSGLQINS